MIWKLIKIEFILLNFKIKKYFFKRRMRYVNKVFNDFYNGR